MADASEHVAELLKLPPEERSAAAEALLLSLEGEGDEGIVAVSWADEIERRIVENEPGIPAATVFAEGRERLRSRLR
jgi:hypothetical protein